VRGGKRRGRPLCGARVVTEFDVLLRDPGELEIGLARGSPPSKLPVVFRVIAAHCRVITTDDRVVLRKYCLRVLTEKSVEADLAQLSRS
jgi:hypothetical protein